MTWKQAMFLAVAIAFAAFAAMIWVAPLLAQDACLDGGGMWKDGRCLQ